MAEAQKSKEADRKKAVASQPEGWCMTMVAAAIYFKDELTRARMERLKSRVASTPGKDEQDTELRKTKPRKISFSDISPDAAARAWVEQSDKQGRKEQLRVVHNPSDNDLSRIMNSDVGKKERVVPGASFGVMPYTSRVTATTRYEDGAQTTSSDWKVMGVASVADTLARELNGLLKEQRVTATVVGTRDEGLAVRDEKTGSVVKAIEFSPGSNIYITKNEADNSVSVIAMLRTENATTYFITRFFRTENGLGTSSAQLGVDKSTGTDQWGME